MRTPRSAGALRRRAGKTKVTMNLDAALVKRAKIAAIVRTQTFGALVERALRVVLRAS